MTVMIKSLARAKLVEPMLSELSTMKARSRVAHLHSSHTENKSQHQQCPKGTDELGV